MAEESIPLQILDSKSNAKLDKTTKRLLIDGVTTVTDGENTINLDLIGNRVSLPVVDLNQSELLKQILSELKNINIHLQSMTDERI